MKYNFSGGRPNCFVSVSFQQPAHVKQNAETNSKLGAACQACLAVDLMVVLAVTRQPAWDKGSKVGEPKLRLCYWRDSILAAYLT